MPNSRNERLLLGVVLLITATLRMGWPGLTEFKADEARLLSLALDMAEGYYFPVRGIGSSLGFPNFPISVWLYAVPAFLCKDQIMLCPYAATLFTGLLSTLSVVGCWWIARRYWGAEAALAAAFMYAVSPWAVIYSRRIWAQNLLPLFVVGWAITSLLAFVEGRRWLLAAHLGFLAAVVQLHLSGVALVPVTGLALFVFRRQVDWRWLLLGLAMGVAMAAPLAWHLLMHGSDMGVLWTALRDHAGDFDFRSLQYTALVSTGWGIHSLVGYSAFRTYLQSVPDITWVHGLWAGLMVAGGCWLVAGRISQSSSAERRWRIGMAGRMVVLWLMAPVLFFAWQLTPIFPHYFGTTFPAQYIVAGVAMATVLERVKRQAERWSGWGMLLMTGALQVWVYLGLIQFLGAHTTPGGFGTPLRMKLAAVDKAVELVESGQAWEVLVIGEGDSPEVHEAPAVYRALLRGTPHRFVDGNASAVRTLGPVAALLLPGRLAAGAWYHDWAVAEVSTPLRIGEGALNVLTLPGRTAAMAPSVAFPQPHTLANGVVLRGYEILPGRTPRWALYWQVGSASVADYHFFNHLLDSDGQRVGQADAAAFPATQWRQGDEVISFFSAKVEPETLRVGMYTYPDVANVPVLDVMGNPAADAVTARWNWPSITTN